MSIRFAQVDDLTDIVNILAHSFYSDWKIGRWLFPILRMGIYEDLRQRLCYPKSSHGVCLVAIIMSKIGLQVVGTVEVSFRPSYSFNLRSSYYPYISNLAVQTQYRHHGVAQKLLSACEVLAREYGFHKIYLHVLEDNYPANQLYLKVGYQVHQADLLWCSSFFRKTRRFLLLKQLKPGQ